MSAPACPNCQRELPAAVLRELEHGTRCPSCSTALRGTRRSTQRDGAPAGPAEGGDSHGWFQGDAPLRRADETGKHEKTARRPLARKWKIWLIQLNNVLDVEESEQGVLTGLKESGLVEGRDYELATLMPFWQLTSEQDWEICERQQRGINSSAYSPGPYSPFKEYNVDSFVRWYLKSLGANGS